MNLKPIFLIKHGVGLKVTFKMSYSMVNVYFVPFPRNTSDISQTIRQINLINGNFWRSMEGMLVQKSTQTSHFWLIG